MKRPFLLIMLLVFSQVCFGADRLTLSMGLINCFSFPDISFFSTVSIRTDPVRDLSTKDFTLTEDGVLIEEFSIAVKGEPVNVGLVLDTSGSVKQFIDKIKSGAISFITQLKDSDKGMVIEFSGSVVVDQKLTFEKDKLVAAVNSLRAEGGTRLYDGIFRGLEELDGRNRILVVFTDGKDVRYSGDKKQYSDHALEEVIQKAVSEKVSIYTIGTGNELDTEMLARISRETGGKFFHATDPGEIKALYTRVSEVLNYHYFFQYKTPNLKRDGQWRTVKLKELKTGTEVIQKYKVDQEIQVPATTAKNTVPIKVKGLKVKGLHMKKATILKSPPTPKLKMLPSRPFHATPEELEAYEEKCREIEEFNRVQREIYKKKLAEWNAQCNETRTSDQEYNAEIDRKNNDLLNQERSQNGE